MNVKKVFGGVALILLVAGAWAQDPNGGPPRFGGRGFGPGMMGGGMPSLTMLVMRKDVQDELKLTDDQKSQLDELRQSMRPPGGRGGPGGGPGGGGPGGDGGGPGGPPMDDNGGPGGPPPGDGGPGGPPPGDGNGPGGVAPSHGPSVQGQGPSEADRAAFMKRMEAQEKKNLESLKKILTADQMKRLKEIAIQLAGNAAASDADVQKSLGLSEDQKSKIKSLVQKQRDANRAIFESVRSGEIDRSEIPDIMKKNTKLLNDEIAKVLTDDQKASLKTMGGKTFVPADDNKGSGN